MSHPETARDQQAQTYTAATERAPRVEDWAQPQAMALPTEGYFEHEPGKYGPIYPMTVKP